MVDFGMLFLLTHYFYVHYLISAAIAFCLGLTVNYLISIVWVFTKRSIEKRWLEFVLYSIIGIVGLGLNELIMWVATGLIGLFYLISKVISTAVVYLWNFSARRFILFR